MLREMLDDNFFDDFGYQVPASEACAGDVVQIDYTHSGNNQFAGKRRVFFGVIDGTGVKMQVFGPSGVDVTMFSIWLNPPGIVKVWRPGR